MDNAVLTDEQRAEQVVKELARRQLAKRRLIHFTKHTHPDYQIGWVHNDIAMRLERFSQDVADKKSPRLMLLVPPRHGKLLAHDTLVPTPDGFRSHGDLQPGDFVFSPSGLPIEVLAVSPDDEANLEVTFYNGERIVCHPQHEWAVFDRGRHKERVVETADMVGESPDRARFQVPLIKALFFAPKDLPIDPYFLGVWLGDGKSSEPVLCGTPEDMAHIVPRIPYPLGWGKVQADTGVQYQGFVGGIRALLRTNDLLNNKHIPEMYHCSSEAQRRSLLAGLVDTDGCVEAKTQRVRFRSGSERLARDVLRLVRSLGYRGGIDYTPVDMRDRRIRGGESWCVQWTPHDGMGGGTLPRKVVTRRRDRRRIGVLSVKAVPSRPGKCIQVDSADGLYLVGETLIPTHNSELASIRLPAWHLGRFPHHEIINVGYNLDLPMEFSRKVRELLRDPAYQALFPEAQLDATSQATESWRLTKGGGFKAAGVGGGITGKGAHILIIDDPIKNMEEADSADRRQLLDYWYQSTAYTRLAPGGGVLVIQTWWNYDDLAGRLQQRMAASKGSDQWQVVRYPALSDEGYEYRDENTWEIVRSPEALDPIPEGYTLLREKDKALHEERYSTKTMVNFKENMFPRVWSALYQQRPVPDEGVYFKKEWFQFLPTNTITHDHNVYTAWDFAIGTKQQNDYTVGATVTQDPSGSVVVEDIHRMKGGTFDIVEAMLNTAESFSKVGGGSYILGVEDGQIWKAIEPVLRQRMNERKLFPSIQVLKPLSDKAVRARPLQARLDQRKLWFLAGTSWLEDTLQELLRFPGGAHDDIVDALAWAVRLTLDNAPRRVTPPKAAKSWKDRFKNKRRTFMSA